MPRQPRMYSLVEDGFYHIICRGNNKKIIFKEPKDYALWKLYLNDYKKKYKVKVIAYCLMNNHYHLLVRMKKNLSRLIASLNTKYAMNFNSKYQRCGHLFQGRYKSYLVSSDPYLITLTRYIHNNPVRAKLVDAPTDYPYSSLRDYNKGRGLTDVKEVEKLIDTKLGGTPLVHILS